MMTEKQVKLGLELDMLYLFNNIDAVPGIVLAQNTTATALFMAVLMILLVLVLFYFWDAFFFFFFSQAQPPCDDSHTRN